MYFQYTPGTIPVTDICMSTFWNSLISDKTWVLQLIFSKLNECHKVMALHICIVQHIWVADYCTWGGRLGNCQVMLPLVQLILLSACKECPNCRARLVRRMEQDFVHSLHKGHSAPHVPHGDAKSLLHPGGLHPVWLCCNTLLGTERLSTPRKSARLRIMQELKFFIKGHGH